MQEGAKDLFDGYFIVETDPKIAGNKLVDVIKQKRQKLGI